MLAYPWSSLTWYLSAREHRPSWIRTDRLLAAHGVADNAAGRELFESNLEARRADEDDPEEWKPLRRGWCLGSKEFKNDLLERIAGDLGPSHAGEIKREEVQVVVWVQGEAIEFNVAFDLQVLACFEQRP